MVLDLFLFFHFFENAYEGFVRNNCFIVFPGDIASTEADLFFIVFETNIQFLRCFWRGISRS